MIRRDTREWIPPVTPDPLTAAELERRIATHAPQTPPSYVCPRCGARSFNPNYIANKYCGRCRTFEAIT